MLLTEGKERDKQLWLIKLSKKLSLCLELPYIKTVSGKTWVRVAVLIRTLRTGFWLYKIKAKQRIGRWLCLRAETCCQTDMRILYQNPIKTGASKKHIIWGEHEMWSVFNILFQWSERVLGLFLEGGQVDETNMFFELLSIFIQWVNQVSVIVTYDDIFFFCLELFSHK